MLNVITLDLVEELPPSSTLVESTKNEGESVSSLLRKVEMWKARALFPNDCRQREQSQHNHQLSATKQKYDELKHALEWRTN